MGKEKKGTIRFKRKQLKPHLAHRKTVQTISTQRAKRQQRLTHAVHRAKYTKEKRDQQLETEQKLFKETENFISPADKQENDTESIEDFSDDFEDVEGLSSEEGDIDDISSDEVDMDRDGKNKKLPNIEEFKEQIKSLRKQDPEFYKYLEDADKDILEMDSIPKLHGKKNIKNENEENDIKSISLSDIKKCGAEIGKGNILQNFKFLLTAYSMACKYGSETESEAEDGKNQKQIENFRFSDSAAYSEALFFTLNEADGIFRKFVISNSNKREDVKWKDEKIKKLFNDYMKNTLVLFNQSIDDSTLSFVLQRLKASIDLIGEKESMMKRIIRLISNLLVTAGKSTQIQAVLIFKDIILKFSESTIEGIYTSFCKVAQSISKKIDFEHLKFLSTALIELYGLNPETAYKRIFCSIRSMSVDFRQSLLNSKIQKKITSGAFINSLELWAKFLSLQYNKGDLKHLIYPTAQLMTGIARLQTSPLYFPMRLRILRSLNMLSSATGVYIPVSLLLLHTLEWQRLINKKAVWKSPKDDPCDFEIMISVSEDIIKRQDYQYEVLHQGIELLCSHLALYSHSIFFPELSYYPLIHLKKFCDTIAVPSYRKWASKLIAALNACSAEVMRRRESINFSPKDIKNVEKFEEDGKKKGKSMLESLAENLILERKSIIAAFKTKDVIVADIKDNGGGDMINEEKKAKKLKRNKKGTKYLERKKIDIEDIYDKNDVLEEYVLSEDDSDKDIKNNKKLRKI